MRDGEKESIRKKLAVVGLYPIGYNVFSASVSLGLAHRVGATGSKRPQNHRQQGRDRQQQAEGYRG
jgi:hypothetical protein